MSIKFLHVILNFYYFYSLTTNLNDFDSYNVLEEIQEIHCLQETDSCIPPHDPSHDPLFVCCDGLECKDFERRNTKDFVVGACLPQGNENET